MSLTRLRIATKPDEQSDAEFERMRKLLKKGPMPTDPRSPEQGPVSPPATPAPPAS